MEVHAADSKPITSSGKMSVSQKTSSAGKSQAAVNQDEHDGLLLVPREEWDENKEATQHHQAINFRNMKSDSDSQKLK